QEQRIGLKRLDESELALHAGTVLAQAPAQIAIGKLQAFLQLAPPIFIYKRIVQFCEQVQDLAPRQVRVDPHLAWQVSDVESRTKSFRLAVVAEDRGAPARRPQQVQKDPDGGGFARAVQPEESENLARRNLEIEIFHCDDVPVPLCETADGNGGHTTF